MCGVHEVNGTPIGHHHGPVFRPRPRARSRRVFLGEFGRGTLALAVFTPLVAACGGAETGTDSGAGRSTVGDGEQTGTDTGADAAGTTRPGTGATSTTDGEAGGAGDGATDDELRWGRANLGFVSAYVLARGNSAAIVDTGTAGSAEAIGETLQTMGLNYDDVDHVILTHKHEDHIGSLAEVLDRATSAAVYAGEADLGDIATSAAGEDGIVGLIGGEDVFGFEIVATPGHTLGHMSVIDHQAGLLVAGDAIFTAEGGVVEGPERFFDDVGQSRQTIKALAQLSFNTLLVGHGDPIEERADTAVAALADLAPLTNPRPCS